MNAPKPLEKVDEIRDELRKLIDRIPEPSPLPLAPPDVKIIFVAVHGVGDQFRFETIQAVSYAVCRYVGQPAAIPLGHYHSKSVEISGAYVPTPGRDPDVKCGFAEMYWADVPRESVDEKYTLEETRKWARNIAARLDLLARNEMEEKCPAKDAIDQANQALKTAYANMRQAKTRAVEPSGNPEVDYAANALTEAEDKAKKARKPLDDALETWRKENHNENELIQNLLEEVVQGVTIADRLAFLAEKAGLFKFELKKLLLDYVDDIQVVTEFQGSRDRLVAKFGDLMTLLADKYPDAKIHVVAHSEGTVVSLLGLLKGFRDPTCRWTQKVHGLMTFGSPLNKHIKLWPELFRPDTDLPDYVDVVGGKRMATDAKGQQLTPPAPKDRIRWRNYYDYGDPIGFDLEPTRLWIKEHGWEPFFEFDEPATKDKSKPLEDDIGFTRYKFPGVAHIGYWTDEKVFGHFLATVVDPEGEVLKPADPVAAKILKEHAESASKSTDSLVEKLDQYWRPLDDAVATITSYVLPYLVAVLLLLIGVYLLYKSIRAYLVPLEVQFETSGQMAINVLGLAALIAGVSLLARIPCLTPRLAIKDLWPGKPEALSVTRRNVMIDAQRDTRREALAALGWRSLAVLFALLSLGYLVVSGPNRISIERFLVDAGPALGSFSFDQDGWYGVKSFEAWMVALVLLLAGLAWKLGGKEIRPPLLVLVPSLIAWAAVRIGLARLAAPAANTTPAFTLDLSSPYLIAGIATGLGAWLLATSCLIEGRPSIKRVLAVAVMVGVVLLIHGSYQGTLAAVPVRAASLAFIGLAWLIGLMAWLVGRLYPKFGARPLIHTGGFVLLLLIGFELYESWRPSPAGDHRREAEIKLKARIERLNNVMKAHPEWVQPANDAPPIVGQVEACGCCLTSFPRGAEGEPTTVEGFRAEAAEVAALQHLMEATPSHGSILPVAGFAPVFLYLWWLAIMTFDLTFIWHLYVRHDGARHYVKAMISRAAKMGETPPGHAPPRPVPTQPSSLQQGEAT